MRNLLTLTAIFISLSSFAQERKFEPFKLVIIKPDTAIIEPSLNKFQDSVTKSQIAKYYRGVKTYQDMANCKTCDFEKEDIERYKNIAADLKQLEPAIKKFKYFETLSSYSNEIYNFYFNEQDVYSIVTEVPSQNISNNALKLLAENNNADYIVFFNKIHTTIKNNLPQLMLTTSLYSKKENKIILNTETTADSNNRGEMWACTNLLDCLLMNGVRTSTNEVADLLRKLQAKK